MNLYDVYLDFVPISIDDFPYFGFLSSTARSGKKSVAF